LNTAPATPVSTAAATIPAGDVTIANNPNASTRSAQPSTIIGRQPSRSAAVPPTRKSPCCESVRTPSTRPTSAAA
jgi:hypothetical protein